MKASTRALIGAVATAVVLPACGASPANQDGSDQQLTISAIPDQDPELLQRLYGDLADYLGEELDVPVRYVPVTDYTASVTSFRRGDLNLVFFGGLTGVQARDQVPGSVPIAQRDIDAEFRSVFVANSEVDIEEFDDVSGLTALKGHSFTFGSDSSTSGRLMPQYFMAEAGVEIDDLSGNAGFSESHDATAKLVETGSYDAGTLNAAVWDERVDADDIDTNKVDEVFRTPIYHDYHWLARPDLDEAFGDGFTDDVTEALLALDTDDPQHKKILDMFQAEEFVETEADNYAKIEEVARETGLL